MPGLIEVPVKLSEDELGRLALISLRSGLNLSEALSQVVKNALTDSTQLNCQCTPTVLRLGARVWGNGTVILENAPNWLAGRRIAVVTRDWARVVEVRVFRVGGKYEYLGFRAGWLKKPPVALRSVVIVACGSQS
jgi:hypothetical protein